MIHEKNHFIKHCSAKVGGGGIHCPCCWPQDKRAQKVLLRMIKKSFRRKMKQHILNELDD